MNFKVNILYPIKDGPWGGGNQFLKALKKNWEELNIYEDNPEKADVILFNSFDKLLEVFDLKQRLLNNIFIHRVDGPIYLVRGRNKSIDKEVFLANELIADGTIFQSNWCKEASLKQGMKKNGYETVISNAPDNNIFNQNNKTPFSNDRKIKIVAASWSDNWNKGFKTYQFLDKHLDFNNYEMIFIGRSPTSFKNIKIIPPQDSLSLAKIFKESDIYITASKTEPCSNSLIEALSCGLPSIALNSGGHPEIIGEGGILFEKDDEIPAKIDELVKNYNYYRAKLPVFLMDKTAAKYLEFMKEVFCASKNPNYKRKSVNYFNKSRLTTQKLFTRISDLINKFIWI